MTLQNNVYNLRQDHYAREIPISLKRCRRILAQFDSIVFKYNGHYYDGSRIRDIIRARIGEGSLRLLPSSFYTLFPKTQ